MKLFDTHAHVNDGRFDNDRDEMLQACFDAGVEYIMIPGVDRSTVEFFDRVHQNQLRNAHHSQLSV